MGGIAMKVLVISNYNEGHASRPEAEAFIKLHGMGIEVVICSSSQSSQIERFRSTGMRVIPFSPEKKNSKEAIVKIRDELIREKYDVLHCFNSVASSNGIRAAKSLPVKLALYRGYTGNIHWWDPFAYQKYLHPRVDGVWCISDSTKRLIDHQRWFGPSIARKILKGHDLRWYDSIAPSDLSLIGIKPESFVVACSANIRRMKGLKYLLRAMYVIPPDADIHLLLMGSGMDKPAFKKLIEQCPNKRKIHVLGYRSDNLSITKSCDIFALASIYGEATTKSVIEAMCLKTTPVVTNIPGNRELVIHQKNGLVVPPKNHKALADSIMRLYVDRAEWRRLAEAARMHIESAFSLDQTAVELKTFYEDLIAGKIVG